MADASTVPTVDPTAVPAGTEPYFVFVVREYVIPPIVFIAMLAFLWKNAFLPLMRGGLVEFKRVPRNGPQGEGDSLLDDSDRGVAAVDDVVIADGKAESSPPSSPSETAKNGSATRRRKAKKE